MSDIPKNQISDWLKKLERESWQLELLVSAFTIFLLIQAIIAFDSLITDIEFQYNMQSSMLSMAYIFLGLLLQSLKALAFCLIAHLMLRGFWIGTIGLRSVQSNIDFSQLHYSEFFTEKLRNKVISLDQLVIKLDEICSVIFAFAFLVISILMAFGMYLLLLGAIVISLNGLAEITPDWFDSVITWSSVIIMLTVLFTGLIYMIDYLTLGFFKKLSWFAKVYYPFYRFYNFITFSALSRSIYYYMISKFSKKRIRMLYAVGGVVLVFSFIVDFDQHPYFPQKSNEHFVPINCYDNLRPVEDYISKVSIPSDFIDQPYLKIFLRYDARDNDLIQSHCEDFIPMKEEGFNWRLKTELKGGNLHIGNENYHDEDFEKLLNCQRAIYQVVINDSIYNDLKFHFYRHPSKDQRGIITTISTSKFIEGENLLEVKKVILDSAKSKSYEAYAHIPFWVSK